MKTSVHQNWVPPQEFSGDTVIVLGSGNSIVELGHDRLLPNFEGKYPVICCNSSFLLAPWAEILFFADARWYRDNEWCLDRHLGWRKVTRRPPPGRPKFPIHTIRAEHRGGLSLNPTTIFWRNSGHMALNLAVHLGAARVILVGVDMVTTAKKQNFHTLHSRPTNVDAFKTWRDDFELARPVLDKLNVSVLHANANSAVRSFPFCELEDFV